MEGHTTVALGSARRITALALRAIRASVAASPVKKCGEGTSAQSSYAAIRPAYLVATAWTKWTQSLMSSGGATRDPSLYGPSGASGAAHDGVPPKVYRTGSRLRPAPLTNRSRLLQSNWSRAGSTCAQRVSLSHSRTAPTRNVGIAPLLLFIVTP